MPGQISYIKDNHHNMFSVRISLFILITVLIQTGRSSIEDICSQNIYEYDFNGRPTIEIPEDSASVQAAFGIFEKIVQ